MGNPVLDAEYAQLRWVPVESTNLKAVAFVPGLRLWVEFHRKPGSRGYSVYAYDHVPADVYLSLLAAGSKGGYFAANVKNVYAVRPYK